MSNGGMEITSLSKIERSEPQPRNVFYQKIIINYMDHPGFT